MTIRQVQNGHLCGPRSHWYTIINLSLLMTLFMSSKILTFFFSPTTLNSLIQPSLLISSKILFWAFFFFFRFLIFLSFRVITRKLPTNFEKPVKMHSARFFHNIFSMNHSNYLNFSFFTRYQNKQSGFWLCAECWM